MTLQPLLPAPGPATAVSADPAVDGLASGAAFGAALAALVGASDADSTPAETSCPPPGEAPCATDLAVLAQLAGLVAVTAPVQAAVTMAAQGPQHVPGAPGAGVPGGAAELVAAAPAAAGPDLTPEPLPSPAGPATGAVEAQDTGPTAAPATSGVPGAVLDHLAGQTAATVTPVAGQPLPDAGGRDTAPPAAAAAVAMGPAAAQASDDLRDGADTTAGDDETASSAPPTGTVSAAVVAPGTSGTGTVSGAGAPGDGAAAGRPAADAVPDQVLQHLTAVRALRDGGHRTVLRLDPEHLGEVTLTLDVRDGAVRLSVSGGAEALEALRSGLGDLRSSLAEAGLALDDVRLRPETATGTAPGTGDDRGRPPGGADAGSTGGPGAGSGRDGRAGDSGGEGGRDGRAADLWRPDPVPRPVSRSAHPDDAGTGSSLDVRV